MLSPMKDIEMSDIQTRKDCGLLCGKLHLKGAVF